MKKLAMFVGEPVAEYQYEICGKLISEAEKRNIKLTIFQNFSAYGSNVFHSYGERGVVHIPNMKNYDGFILATDTFNVSGMYEELKKLLQMETNAPVICLRWEDPDFYNVLVDDYAAMSEMVEHLITHHGFERICFMKGLPNYKDAKERLRAYVDVMKKHNLEIRDRMIFDGDYWREKGEEAVSWFLGGQDELPQAIVCANDYMAISVLEALQKRGIRVPEDICVTGFDDRDECRLSIPPLTSVHVENDPFILNALEMMENIWAGKDQEKVSVMAPSCRFRGSCGCYCSEEGEKRLLFELKESMETALNKIPYMSVDFENANSYEDLFLLARNYIYSTGVKDKIFICFCDDEEKEVEQAEMQGKYTKYMELKAILMNDKIELCNEKFLREDILPARFKDHYRFKSVTTLHHKNDCIGYVVITSPITPVMRFFYQTWIQGISNGINRLNIYTKNEQLAEMMRQYNIDTLTGIYNRREMDTVLRNAHTNLQMEGQEYYILEIDMDRLKYINDNFGHTEGDEALCNLARILDSCKIDNSTLARVGGDEFMMCMITENESKVRDFITSARKGIAAYNAESGKPYELSASIGFARCVKGMQPMICIQKADKMMYQEKKKKKMERTD